MHVGGLTLWLPKILLKLFSLCWNGTLPLLALFLWMIWFNFSSEGDRKPSCTEKPTEPAKTSLECSERVWAPKSRCCDYCDCCVLCQGTGHQRSRHNMNVMWCVWGEPGVGNHFSPRSIKWNSLRKCLTFTNPLMTKYCGYGEIPPLTFWISVGKETVPRHFAAQRQWQEIVPGFNVDDAVEILLWGRTQNSWRTNRKS